MAEPSRKKSKGQKVHSAPNIGAEREEDALYFVTNHKEKPCVVDLRPFARGVQADDNARLRRAPFTGRTELINELAPAIKELTINAPSHTVEWHLRGLRAYWRLFDKHEDKKCVNRLVDIDDLYGALQMRDGVRGSITTAFLKAVNLSRTRRGLHELYWTKNDDEPGLVDLPNRKHIAAIYSELKHLVIAARQKFDYCNMLAQTGQDYANVEQLRPGISITEADQHATYRGFIRRSGEIVLNRTQVEALGVTDPEFLSSVETLAAGVYPSMAEVQASFLLFLVKSGWNPQTALDIDITQNYVIPHPTSRGYHIVRAVKNRGKTIQCAMGQDKSEFSPKSLLEHLIRRTTPLREHLQRELTMAQEFLKENPANHTLRLRISKLQEKVRSPWLFANPNSPHYPVNALNGGNYNYSPASAGGSVVKSLIRNLNCRLLEANKRAKEHHLNVLDYAPISETITVSDFRDAFAAYAYEASGYNWLMVKLALGHRSYESTKTYLRKREYKAEGQTKVLMLTTSLLEDIERHRLVEPIFLFFQVERGELTDEQRQRYFRDKNRTRVGTGCADFTHPPPEISPSHVEGKGCRIQRCTLCRHAIVFPDSVKHLARRLAELNRLREQLSVLTWNESSFSEERANADAALKLFDSAEVEMHLQFWTREISEGRHRPLDMEGSYA